MIASRQEASILVLYPLPQSLDSGQKVFKLRLVQTERMRAFDEEEGFTCGRNCDQRFRKEGYDSRSRLSIVWVGHGDACGLHCYQHIGWDRGYMLQGVSRDDLHPFCVGKPDGIENLCRRGSGFVNCSRIFIVES